MSAYRPKQRSISVAVYTSAGWVSGSVSAPPLQGLIDFLNQSKGFVKLTGVTLPSGAALPFFALQRKAAVVVVPLTEDEKPGRTVVGATSPRLVSILLDSGALTGVIDVVSNLRVSDYLMQHTDFIGLRDCEMHVAAPGVAPGAIPYAIVNAERIIGASEDAAGATARQG